MSFTIIGPNGKPEEGTGSGVQREIYSSFWEEVSYSYMVGEVERVPVVRHDLFTVEWKAIGNILVKGHIDTGYFPIYLSKAFVCYCIFGEVSSGELINSFKFYLSADERETVSKALEAEETDTIYESDEFMDLLDQFKCRSRVTRCNVENVIAEIARQELIQKPYIMTACWAESFALLHSRQSFHSREELDLFYNNLKPTTKTVINLLQGKPNGNNEQEVFSYLKRYIRGLESGQLKKLLKFLTGSKLIVVESIEVIFIKPLSDFSRRPIVHTCGPSLDLPSSYNSFCELREEFSNILLQNSSEMDIV